MSEEIDLTNVKFILDREIYLSVIKGSLLDNYPIIDLDKELNDSKMTEQDLLDQSKYQIFTSSLANKYENDAGED